MFKMSELRSVCRTCGKNVENSGATELFEKDNYNLVCLIENITDMYLEFDTSMPDLICHWCKQQLDRIMEFRKNCLKVHQSFLVSNRNRLQGMAVNNEEPDEQEVELEESYQEDKAEEEDLQLSPKTIICERGAKRSTPSSKTWVCDQCGGVFKAKSVVDIRLHLQRHTGHKPFGCDICQAKFYTKNEMHRHRILHSDARPYACRICSKTFRSCSSRAIHERSHTNERPFQCQHCDKAFTSSSSRQRHEILHTADRKYHCETCNCGFYRPEHLALHKKSKLHQQRVKGAPTD